MIDVTPYMAPEDGDETPSRQIERLACFIRERVPGEPSRSEGAVDTAIRVIAELRATVALVERRERVPGAAAAAYAQRSAPIRAAVESAFAELRATVDALRAEIGAAVESAFAALDRSPSRYGAGFDRKVRQWSVLENEHDRYHPDREDCGGVGGCSMMFAAGRLEQEMIEALVARRRAGCCCT